MGRIWVGLCLVFGFFVELGVLYEFLMGSWKNLWVACDGEMMGNEIL